MKEKGLQGKEQLFELLVHDLTGPLSVASTSTHNLLYKGDRYGPLTEAQKRVIERILRNIHRGQNLLHEMIEVSRSEEGLFKKEFFLVEKVLKESFIDVLEIDDPRVVERLIHSKEREEFQSILKTQGILVDLAGRYCHSPFCHDSNKVRQILRNLIGNALKYRREKMKVSIEGEGDLFILVEDDGFGIPTDAHNAIYERFVRLHDAKGPDVPGYGLGLPGVKSLVEAMKGEISLVSLEGAGTCFKVRVPSL
jgi:signal transduction histidine kinase